MKILHTSDWHLGITLGGRSLYEDQMFFLDQLYKAVEENAIDIILIAGDIYDSSVSSSSAIGLYNEAVTRLCKEMHRKVIIVAGNHDGAARLSACSALLEDAGLFVTGKLHTLTQSIDFGNVSFYPIPHFNIDEARVLYPKSDIRTYTDAYKAVCDTIRLQLKPDRKNIAVIHTFVTGAATCESDRSAVVGSLTSISSAVFEGFDYVAAGHIHKPQNVTDICRYSGTPLPYSFSEAKQQKSFTVINTDTMVRTIVPINPLHNMQIIGGSFDVILEKAQYCEDYIKIEIEKGFAGLEQQQLLREYYPNLIMITSKSERSSEGEQMLTCEDIAAMSTKELTERFFADTVGYTPTQAQINLFENALEKVENGGDRQ